MLRKTIVMFFVLTLAFTAFANGKNESKGSEAEGPTVLTLLGKDGMKAGIQRDPVAQAFTEETGLQIDIIMSNEDKFKLMLAGSDLPDVFYSNMTTQGMVDFVTLINGNHVLPLDDLIAENAPNLSQFTTKLEYSRRFKSNGRNQVFFIPTGTKVEGSSSDVLPIERMGGIRYYGRWDLYKKTGAPQINSQQDLLNALKAMQDLNPTTPEGNKVYALSAWTDWGLWPYFIPPMYGEGYFYTTQNIYYKRDTGEYNYLYLTDEFWKGIEFFNDAYNMGILDPEGFTMKLDNYLDKIRTGQVLTLYAHWWAAAENTKFVAAGHPDWGFAPLESGLDYENGLYREISPVGSVDHSVCVSSNAKDPIAAVKFLDFLHSEKGAILVNRGVQGVDWDMVNGKPDRTAEYREKSASDPNYITNQGLATLRHYVGISGNHFASDGGFIDLGNDMDKIPATLTAVEKDFAEYNKAPYPGKVVDSWVKEGRINTAPMVIWPQLVEAESDDTKSITANCEQYIRVAVIDCIMAKNDTEFNKLKAVAIKGMKSRGIDDAMNEYRTLFDQAKAAVKDFKY